MTSRLLTACVAAAALFCAGMPRAAAETVTMSLYQPPAGYPNGVGDVMLDNNPVTAAPIGPLSWTQFGPNGPYSVPPNANFPAQVSTFCIELGNGPNQQITPGLPYTFGVQTPITVPSGDTNAVVELFGSHYSTAWAAPGFGGSPESTAFQIALWELIYDGRPIVTIDPETQDNLTDGRFSLNVSDYDLYRGGAATTAQTWLNGLTGDTSSFAQNLSGFELVCLIAPATEAGKPQTPTQDQIALKPKGAVPAPPGVLLAGVGFLALVGRARWTRAKC